MEPSAQVTNEFTPDPVQLAILRSVADSQGCPIRHVVEDLLPSHGERAVRSSIHLLLAKGYLDGGKPSGDITLRLKSRGRILLQQVRAE